MTDLPQQRNNGHVVRIYPFSINNKIEWTQTMKEEHRMLAWSFAHRSTEFCSIANLYFVVMQTQTVQIEYRWMQWSALGKSAE